VFVWGGPAPVDFVIDGGEDFPGRSSEYLDLAQRLAQAQEVFSRYQRPPAELVEYPLGVFVCGLSAHAADLSAGSGR
jgi:hypothetical protein